MRVKVKVCPFCGNVPNIRKNLSLALNVPMYHIYCSKLDCIAFYCGWMSFENVENAVSLWNERVSKGDGYVMIYVNL